MKTRLIWKFIAFGSCAQLAVNICRHDAIGIIGSFVVMCFAIWYSENKEK